jgi:hypothetical protein
MIEVNPWSPYLETMLLGFCLKTHPSQTSNPAVAESFFLHLLAPDVGLAQFLWRMGSTREGQ